MTPMLTYPAIDPIALQLGPLAIHWYGLTYLIGILGGWALGHARARRPDTPLSQQQMSDLTTHVALGVILGGRLGYVLFYDLARVLGDPLALLRIWEGGMSFHGGLLGVITVMVWYGNRLGCGFWRLADFVAPLVPLGLGAGRIGNFINGELWGRPTDLPWGMVFPGAGPWPRHPSQLYEAFLEGVVLFTLLWLYSRKPRPTRAVSGLFLLLYGMFRFAVEGVREPDAHIGYLAFGWLTMGQLLCLPMIAFGIYLLLWARRHGRTDIPAAALGAPR